MEMLLTALALAGAQAAPSQAPVAQPADHSQHQQASQKHDAKACPCCEHMADGKKMACCEQHEKAESGDHAGHSGH